jgi:hypothetical protein
LGGRWRYSGIIGGSVGLAIGCVDESWQSIAQLRFEFDRREKSS